MTTARIRGPAARADPELAPTCLRSPIGSGKPFAGALAPILEIADAVPAYTRAVQWEWDCRWSRKAREVAAVRLARV
jgi:hypothetical protein